MGKLTVEFRSIQTGTVYPGNQNGLIALFAVCNPTNGWKATVEAQLEDQPGLSRWRFAEPLEEQLLQPQQK